MILSFHHYVVVVDVLQPCDPLVRVDKSDGGGEEKEQVYKQLHPLEVE